MADRPDTARARARAETTEQIKDIARRHLATEGPDLSLRAVARDLGVVSSAVYRYFASRDELLTALIVDGYVSLADAVEAAEAGVVRRDVAGRWAALWRATRTWAVERPHEYALLYGSPIPGYAAPQETIEPALRPVVLGLQLLADGLDRGAVEAPTDRLARPVRADVDRMRAALDIDAVPAPLVSRALTAWAALYGTISFELFGRFRNGVDHLEEYFDHQVRSLGRFVGIR